jgi:hypothetical protein
MGFLSYLENYESKKVVKREIPKQEVKIEKKIVTESVELPKNIVEHANMLLEETKFDPEKLKVKDIDHYNSILG